MIHQRSRLGRGCDFPASPETLSTICRFFVQTTYGGKFMPSDTQTAPVSKKGLWAGRIMSALVILFLAFDVAFKFVKPAPPPVVEGMANLGCFFSILPVVGIVLLVSTALYAIPIASVLGAILLTGYLGGAIAT